MGDDWERGVREKHM